MSVVLNLPKNLVKQLNNEAAAQDKPLDEYVIDLIQRARQPKRTRFQTTAEVLAYWKAEGLIGTRPLKTNSQKLARKLRVQSETRKR